MKRTKIVDHELVTMTPKDAERLLARNYEGNRRIKSRAVANLAAVMEAGEFNSENGQTIMVGVDRKLYDGQHRLSAQVKANIPMKWLVVTVDEADTAYKTLDGGARRSVADYFKDTANSNTFASLAVFAYIIENSSTKISVALNGHMNDERSSKPPKHLVVEFAERNEDRLHAYSQAGVRMYQGAGSTGSKAIYSKFLYIMDYIGEGRYINGFVDDFCSMAPDSKTLISLKMTLMKEYSKDKRSRPKELWTLGLLVDGYMHFADGDEVVMLNHGSARLKTCERKLASVRAEL